MPKQRDLIFCLGIATALAQLLILALNVPVRGGGHRVSQPDARPIQSNSQREVPQPLSQVIVTTSGTTLTPEPLKIPATMVAAGMRSVSFDWAFDNALYNALGLSAEQIQSIQAAIRETISAMKNQQLVMVEKVSDEQGGEYIRIPSLGAASSQFSDSLIQRITQISDSGAAGIIRFALTEETCDFGNYEHDLAIIQLPEEVKKNPKYEREYHFQERVIKDQIPVKWRGCGMGEQLFNERYLSFIEAALRKSPPP